MDELWLIGIGTGNPDHLTRAGEAAIRGADLILIPRKGADKADLAELRLDICRSAGAAEGRIVEFDLPKRDVSDGYLEGVEVWHDAIALAWVEALAGHRGRPCRTSGLGRSVALRQHAPHSRTIAAQAKGEGNPRHHRASGPDGGPCHSSERDQRPRSDHHRAAACASTAGPRVPIASR